MSKFYRDSSSGSDSDTSSDSSAYNQPIKQNKKKAFERLTDDEEDFVKRKVQSPKDKANDALQACIKQVENAKKINDYSKMSDNFNQLLKTWKDKSSLFKQDGPPKFFLRALVAVDQLVSSITKALQKKLSKTNSKGYNTIKRSIKATMVDFEKDIEALKDAPSDDESDSDSGSSDSDASEAPKATKKVAAAASSSSGSDSSDDSSDESSSDSEPVAKKPAGKQAQKYDTDSDFSDWPTSSDEDSDSDIGDEGFQYDHTYFLKKNTVPEAKEKKKRDKKPKEQKVKAAKDEGWSQVTAKGKVKQSMFEKGTDVTHAVAVKKLNEIKMSRGKRSTLRSDIVDQLNELKGICQENNLGVAMDIRIVTDLIECSFDYNNKILDCMKLDSWKENMELISSYIQQLLENTHITVDLSLPREEDNVSKEDQGLRVSGDVVSSVERLDLEFIKILQNADAHSTDYLDYLRHEPKLLDVIDLLIKYCENTNKDPQYVCRAYILKVQYMYYKYNAQNDESAKTLATLCNYIYQNDISAQLRTRAILFQIYNHCLHDEWYLARDLMLMSHLQETINNADIPTMIIFNRTMVQLGLCAFRLGLVSDAHSTLVDVQSTGKAKELLAQGLLMQRNGERISPEQERREKQRQVPFHMHINLELLECVYLVSAMLLEIPYVAAHEFDARRRMISKQFHHQLRVSERLSLVGPPDNMREHVVAASKKLKMGDFQGCFELIVNEKMRNKVWNLFHKSEEVIEMLKQKIKEAALRCYIFTYSQFYDNMSLEVLSERFELNSEECHRVISKMIINEELAASWDEPSSSLVLHKTDPSRIQNMTVQLAEKINQMVDMNEKILEWRAGGYHRGDNSNVRSYRNDGNQNGYQNQRKYQANKRFPSGNRNRNNSYSDQRSRQDRSYNNQSGSRNNYYRNNRY